MDRLPDLAPAMLSGLTWAQARSALGAVDCALRRPHWCSPVVILSEGKLTQDDDGDLSPFTFMRGDRSASDWMMVPRIDDDGNEVPLTYRRDHSHG